LRRFLDRLYAASGILAALCLAAIFVVMMAQSVGRVAGFFLRGADDITAWLCAATAFFALGHTFRHGELVRVGLWLDMLQGTARWVAEIFALGVTAIFTGYMLWAVTLYVNETRERQYVAQGLLKVPEWIPQLTFLLGVAIFFVAVLDELVLVLRKQKPTYQLAEEARRAAGDFSETV
jgi:TRAP-type C4-dicarboxylate transport system permease small subunit